MPKNDDLTKIKELLEIVKHKVDLSESHRSVHSATIHLMKDQLSVMNKKMDDTKESVDVLSSRTDKMQQSLDANTAALMEVEKTLGGYKESYQENQKNIYRLDTRLNVAEEELAIEPPEDLKIPHFVV